ncbi:hypothetical protein RPB92_12615, partial [Staphylococcus haemolyticus]|uniref:hypothetical protein n=1 Tax=Staphylococcus haemolyticus TaxID=1283 RepID=UPI0028A4ADEA
HYLSFLFCLVANNYRGNCAFFLFKNIKIGLMNFVISPIYYRTTLSQGRTYTFVPNGAKP